MGAAYHGDAARLLEIIEPSTVGLIVSSPPFGIDDVRHHRPGVSSVTEWLLSHLASFRRVLRIGGSLVLELGGTWLAGVPHQGTDHLELVFRACSEEEWTLLQTFYWHNPELLVSPEEWVEHRRTRFRECVSTVWWLAATPEAVEVDTRDVVGFYQGDPGSAPGNLLRFRDTEPDRRYRERCAAAEIPPHYAPYPSSFPSFFISLLTRPGELVLDPFAGSCTTGAAAEALGRRWICIEASEALLASAELRF